MADELGSPHSAQVVRSSCSVALFAYKFPRLTPQSYLTYLKGYMKAVKAKLAETNPDEVATFEKAAAAYAKKIVANFKDFEFYTGESMDTEGMVALLVSLDLFTPSTTLRNVFLTLRTTARTASLPF